MPRHEDQRGVGDYGAFPAPGRQLSSRAGCLLRNSLCGGYRADLHRRGLRIRLNYKHWVKLLSGLMEKGPDDGVTGKGEVAALR